ncbi:MAG: hypothetical protein QOF13_462 [Solirubrobacterales bacterium]|jgi:hypothetical protein|nr:hypothetical protein [Solirubrobacterales bacterium]
MIAAARRRIDAVPLSAARRTRQVDRALARRIEKARPVLVRWLRRAWVRVRRGAKALGKRLRPLAVLVLRAFSRSERLLRRLTSASERTATRASATITPARAIAGVILASALCLIASQFVTYSSVEIGQPGYAGLPSASPPTVAGERAGEAHAYLLIPLALLAALAAVMAMRTERRGLGRIVVILGLLCIAVILIVDLPAGLDAGAQSSRFAGATAVLQSGFYAELAAAAGLVMGGLLYYARPCRIRINLSGRAASARRRRRRRRDSSPRKAARKPLRPRSDAASARASRP